MIAVAEQSRASAAKVRRKPRALVLRAPGTNCDRETALALELAGARPESVHVEQLLASSRPLDEFGIVVLPGGFSFGDHLGAGTLWAHRLEGLGDALHHFVADGRPLLGICNGFQAVLKLGLLQGGSLAPNASGHFECRWVWLRKPDQETSPLLDGIELIALPVAHGEGRFVRGTNPVPPAPSSSGPGQGAQRTAVLPTSDFRLPTAQVGEGSLLYCDEHSNPGPYPINPNGSEGDVAALTNDAGNVLGLMPHPERNVLPGQAPAGRMDGAGLAIFRNAVTMARG